MTLYTPTSNTTSIVLKPNDSLYVGPNIQIYDSKGVQYAVFGHGSNMITNDGTITGTAGIGLDGGMIQNGVIGHIYGGWYGINSNYNMIGVPVTIHNDGSVAGGLYGVYGMGETHIENSGSLYSMADHSAFPGTTTFAAVVLNSHTQNSTIVNSGTIAVFSPDDAHSFSIYSGDARETVTNTGNILGKVFLGGGADTYDGRGGHQIGRIDAGAGEDTIYGGDDNDTIDGGGGADYMAGGKGDDTYFVDSAFDKVVEVKGQGIDTVYASSWFSLGGSNVENLTLTGSGATAGIGNDLANVITGNDGANALYGMGGNDTFVFSSALGLDNADHIGDFTNKGGNDDHFALDHYMFTGYGVGALSASAFKDIGTAGAKIDADDRIIYNHKTGDLSYDRDGSATKYDAVKFAVLDNHATLTASDFFFI